MKTRNLIFVFAGLGFVAGVGYWLYLYLADPDNAPTISDLYETAQSYLRRGYLTVTTVDITGDANSGNYLDKAVRIIANFEGFSPKTYQDAGNLAIGYGHDIIPGDGFDANSEITESDGYALLRSDVESRFAPVLSYVNVDLTDNQKAAIISFAYNVGVAAFKNSTMLKLINQGDLDGAADEFAKWNKSQGSILAVLTDRRAQERDLFLS